MGKIKSDMIFKRFYDRESEFIHPNFRIIDNWDTKQFFYLRRNRKNRSIALYDEQNLSQINNDTFCVNFVVDAFNDFKEHYRAKVLGGLKPYLKMEALKPSKGYIKPISDYLIHMKRLESVLLNQYLIPEKDDILTLDDYVFQFNRFLGDYAHKYPILYSTFVDSHFCSLYSTGLFIELKSKSHNKNGERIDAVRDSSFEFFASLAKEYGFTIPKQAPWCLLANLDSRAMMRYAIQYDATTKKQIYNEYYYECKEHDMDLLRGVMFNGLEAFRESCPTYAVKTICESGKIIIKNLNRDLPTARKFNETLDNRKMLRKYIEILLAERKIKIDKLKLDILFEECYYMFEKYSLDVAYTFIEMKIFQTKRDRIR